jgi:hypothetical protein
MSENLDGIPPSPDAESREGRARRATTKFLFTYTFDGTRWGGEVFASTHEEAEMKIRAMGRGRIDGVAGGVIPAEG